MTDVRSIDDDWRGLGPVVVEIYGVSSAPGVPVPLAPFLVPQVCGRWWALGSSHMVGCLGRRVGVAVN